MKVHRCLDLNPLQFFRVAPPASARSDDSAAAAAPGGQKGVFKVPSLLFDIELEDGSAKVEAEEGGVEEVQRRLKFLGRAWSDCEQQLMRQVALAREEASAAGQPLEADRLAERLRCLGHSVTVRTALGGGGGGECLRNLRHTFLNCAVHGTTGSVNYLVDAKFREQFEIAHATPRYSAVLAATPVDFVGTEERIVPLVELLCAEMSAAFRSAGATLPPWRQAGAMLSKWRPRRSEDAGSKSPPSDASAACASAVVNVSAAAGRAPSIVGGMIPSLPPASRSGATALRRYSVGGPAGDWRGVSRELSRARAVATRSSSLLAAELEAARKLCRKSASAAPLGGGTATVCDQSQEGTVEKALKGALTKPAAPATDHRRGVLGEAGMGAPGVLEGRQEVGVLHEAASEPAKPSVAPSMFTELARVVASRAGEVSALAGEQSSAARQMLTGF